MTRFTLIVFLVFTSSSFFSQKLKKQLLTKTWYCSCNFKTDSLILSETNTSKFEWEASFSPTGKLTLKNLKTNGVSTIYSYSLNKNSLRVFYDLKDSLQNLLYAVSEEKLEEEGVFKLDAFYAMRYKKKNKTDLAPADNFTLVKGDKKHTLFSLAEITVHSVKKAGRDSFEYISKGEFLEVRADTMLMNVYELSEHNFQKKHAEDAPYYKKTLYDSLVKRKIPLKEITKIYSPRDKFNSFTTGAAVAAFGVFVVSFPGALIVNNDPGNTIFTRAAIISAVTIPIFISSNMIFAKRKFQIAPTSKNKNTWQFDTKSQVPLTK